MKFLMKLRFLQLLFKYDYLFLAAQNIHNIIKLWSMKQRLLHLLFKYDYLTDAQLRDFRSHKYSSLDSGPLSNYVSNALTLAGFLCACSTVVIASFLDYSLYGASDIIEYSWARPLPNWLWLAFSILTFLAHTLDGIDGKQARRTGTAGPLGELFDHGLDSWATLPFTVTIFSAFGRDNPFRFLAILNSVQLVFFATHWEKYNTGVLYLSWGYDASQYGMALFYLILFFIGYKNLKFDIGPVTFAQICESVFYLSAVASVVVSLYNMYQACHVSKTGKQSSLLVGSWPAIEFFLFVAVGLVHANWSRAPVEYRAINVDPRLCYWLSGAVFSNIACRLIVAQMSNTRPHWCNWNLVAYASLPVVSLLGHAGLELWYGRLLAVALTAAHLHYGCSVLAPQCSARLTPEQYDNALSSVQFHWDRNKTGKIEDTEGQKREERAREQIIEMLKRLLVSLIMGFVLLVLLAIGTGALATKSGLLGPAVDVNTSKRISDKPKAKKANKDSDKAAKIKGAKKVPSKEYVACSCWPLRFLQLLGAHVIGWPPRPNPYISQSSRSRSTSGSRDKKKSERKEET